ncbi:unnamed protein product [Alopecurus aequalis]
MAKKEQQRPWVVQFNGTSKPALVAPFDGWRTHVVDMAALQGKRCLGLDGDWSLMFDELTNECSLVSLANTSSLAPTVIALPPLPDTPPSYLRFGCALSNQSPPNCTVVLGLVREKSLLHCRPGDAEWSRLPVDFDDWEEFDGPITPSHNGKVYATTMGSLVSVDASRPTPVVEWTDLRRPPRCPVHEGYKCYPIPCPDGELFLVRSCFFGCHSELVDVKLFRWNQEDNVWEIVDSIGDRTLFVGRFSFVVPSAAEAGIHSNSVHVLQEVCGEYGIYTVSLDDMTIRLSIVEGCEQDEEEIFWALPTSFGLEALQGTDNNDLPTEAMQRRTEHCCIEGKKEVMATNIVSSQWSDLQADLLHLIVKRISFIDFLHLKAVCKQWNSITSPIKDAKVSPLLITTRPGRIKDLVEVFDPVSEKKYSISINIPASDLKTQGSQLVLHFTKNGWVILSRGPSRGGDHHMFFLVNPFKNYPDGDVIALPSLNVLDLKGISFSSVPGSPDFLVLAVRVTPGGKVVNIQTWRIGDEDWMEECLGNDALTFLMASHSPVFLDGVFYFLDINGRLGVVDPNEEEMEWNVLEKPDQPIRGRDEVHTMGEWDYSYLVEWKRELVAILRECGDDGPIRIFKLDRSRMVWTELEGMEDAAVFWDRSNNALIAQPPPGEDLCNKVYLPNYTETDDGGRAQAFYCLKERRYYPSFNAKEPLNAIWFRPNLEDVLGDVCTQSVR